MEKRPRKSPNAQISITRPGILSGLISSSLRVYACDWCANCQGSPQKLHCTTYEIRCKRDCYDRSPARFHVLPCALIHRPLRVAELGEKLENQVVHLPCACGSGLYFPQELIQTHRTDRASCHLKMFARIHSMDYYIFHSAAS